MRYCLDRIPTGAQRFDLTSQCQGEHDDLTIAYERGEDIVGLVDHVESRPGLEADRDREVGEEHRWHLQARDR